MSSQLELTGLWMENVLCVCNCSHVTLSPSSGSPLSTADKGRRPGSDAVSPTSRNHPGVRLLLLNWLRLMLHLDRIEILKSFGLLNVSVILAGVTGEQPSAENEMYNRCEEEKKKKLHPYLN